MKSYSAIPNTLYGQDGCEICVFTKDPSEEFAAKIKEANVDGVNKSYSVKELRQEFKQYKDKRDLLSEFDLFLADDRIIPLLPQLLGVKFFKKKKHPAPISFTKGNLAKQLEANRDSTFMHLTGSQLLVKIGKTDMKKSQIIENIMAALPAIVDKIPKKWKGVQGVFLKTTSSIALPIYSSLPDEEPESKEPVVEEPVKKTKKVKASAPAEKPTKKGAKKVKVQEEEKKVEEEVAPKKTPKKTPSKRKATAAATSTPKKTETVKRKLRKTKA